MGDTREAVIVSAARTAEVIILFSPISSDGERLALMKEAMSDPLFVADLEEIGEDFRYDVLPAKAC